ncbi:gp436 family protein [Amorphus sp. MBR-141]
MIPFVTLADLDARHPAELITLAADEQTGVRDDVRIELAIADAGAEIRAILKARYSADELGRIDGDSRETLKIYAIDIALYRVALSFSRSNERIEERYKSAIKRLEAIAAGKAALTFSGSEGSDETANEAASPNEVLIDAPERIFTRDRTWGF